MINPELNALLCPVAEWLEAHGQPGVFLLFREMPNWTDQRVVVHLDAISTPADVPTLRKLVLLAASYMAPPVRDVFEEAMQQIVDSDKGGQKE